MNKPKTIRFLSLLLLILIAMMSSSCESEKTATGSVYAFSTLIDISVTSTNPEMDLENIKEIILEAHKLCDNFNEYDDFNNICTINRLRDNVEVPEELVKLLVTCVILRHDTDRYFEYKIGSLSKLYKKLIESGKEEDVPSDELISQELEKLAAMELNFYQNTISIDGEGEIDLGAIGKGYALKKVREYLLRQRIRTYLINAGNSSIIVGEKKGSNDYRIGVREVDNLVLSKKHKAIGTSSLLEQNVTINGELYHHIVNPFTGKNDHYYDTVVVVGDDPLYMDLYSTVLFMMPLEDVKYAVECFELDEVYLCKDKQVIYEYQREKS